MVMPRGTIQEIVNGLKVEDIILINGWLNPMCVCGVSEHYVLAHNVENEYTIIDKNPVTHQYNGITPGAIVCAADWWAFGYADGYHFDDAAWVEKYMRSLETGETEMSMRHREEITCLTLLHRPDGRGQGHGLENEVEN